MTGFVASPASDEQMAQRRLHDDLTTQAKRLTCDRCLSPVWVAWAGDTWKLRCKEGWAPDMVKQSTQMARREGKMLQRYEPNAPTVLNEGALSTVGAMPETRIMSKEEFDNRMGLMKHVVGSMEEGVHYGVIPGTKDKSLWEPGAEYLRTAFNIQWGHELTEQSEDPTTHDYKYTFFAFQLVGPGIRGAGWTGSAWSKERKFYCRGGRDGCPNDCPQTHWPSMEAQMLPHNVRDRALKRAFVAMIRNLTGSTGYFKQALDVQDGGVAEGDGEPTTVDHLWLRTCPEHKVAWFKKGNMREPSHKQGEGWCNQSTVLKPLLDAELKAVTADSWEKAEVNPWLKERFDGTWGQLTLHRKFEALAQLRVTPPPGATEGPASTPPTNMDPATGEVIDAPATKPATNDGQGGFAGMAPGSEAPAEH